MRLPFMPEAPRVVDSTDALALKEGIWQKMNTKRFDNIMIKTKTVGARALPEGIEVTFAAAGQCEAGGNARVISSVAYTDPEVAWVGLIEDQTNAKGIKVRRAWPQTGLDGNSSA